MSCLYYLCATGKSTQLLRASVYTSVNRWMIIPIPCGCLGGEMRQLRVVLHPEHPSPLNFVSCRLCFSFSIQHSSPSKEALVSVSCSPLPPSSFLQHLLRAGDKQRQCIICCILPQHLVSCLAQSLCLITFC